MSSSRRVSLIAVLLVLVTSAIAGVTSARASTRPRVYERPVSFTVQNVNQTPLPCVTDGQTYTIRGHLVGTRAELRSGKVTLLLHGLGLGQFFWRLQGVPGYDFEANLARLGHASVAIDRLGYGTSGKPAGTASCIGGQADIAHQIIGQLKAGRYQGAGSPRFRRVGLIGHSAGGQITEVESYTFHDARAIGIFAYADQGLSTFQLQLAAAVSKVCAAGGVPQDETSGPDGYASLAGNLDNALTAFLHSAPDRVQAAVIPQFSLDPCGDLASYGAAPSVDLTHLSSIRQPALLVQGGKDTLFPPPSVARQAKLLTGSRSVTYAELPDAGHALTFERGHEYLAQITARFLSRNGL